MAKGATLAAGGGSHTQRACCGWYVLDAGGKTCSPCDVEVKARERPTALLDQGVVETAESCVTGQESEDLESPILNGFRSQIVSYTDICFLLTQWSSG